MGFVAVSRRQNLLKKDNRASSAHEGRRALRMRTETWIDLCANGEREAHSNISFSSSSSLCRRPNLSRLAKRKSFSSSSSSSSSPSSPSSKPRPSRSARPSPSRRRLVFLFLTRCAFSLQKQKTKPGSLDFFFSFREHLRPLRRRPLCRAPRLRRRGADRRRDRGPSRVWMVADQGVQAVPGAGECRRAVHEVSELFYSFGEKDGAKKER